MYKLKMASLFFEASQYGCLAAIADRLDAPLKVKSIETNYVLNHKSDLKPLVKSLTRVSKDQHACAYCNFYPESRFLYQTEVEDPQKGRDDPDYFPVLLQQEFNIEAAANMIAVIDSDKGTPFGAPPLPKKLIFAGALSSEIKEIQDRYVSSQIYPDHFEMGHIRIIGGLKSYLSHIGIKESVLMIDITPTNMFLNVVKGRSLELVRSIDMGWNAIFEKVQSIFGLPSLDEARTQFYAGTLDRKRLQDEVLIDVVKNIQSVISFYELQGGGSVGFLIFPSMPNALNWWREAFCELFQLKSLPLNYSKWLSAVDVTIDSNINSAELGEQWFGLFSLVADLSKNTAPSADEISTANTETKTDAALNDKTIEETVSQQKQGISPDTEPSMPDSLGSVNEQKTESSPGT